MRAFIGPILAVALASSPAWADGRSQLEKSVAQDLPYYVKNVDTRDLDHAKLASLYMIINGGGSEGKKQAQIKSVLGGRHSLFGLGDIRF